MAGSKYIPNLLLEKLGPFVPSGPRLVITSLVSLHILLSIPLLFFAAKGTPDAANAKEGVAKLSVEMGLQKLAPKLIKLFSRGISIPNPIESVVAKATEAVGGGVAKATQAAGEGLDAAKNTGKELVAEVLEKAKVNITAMIGNKQGCIGAAIGSDNIGSVCGDLSSRLLVVMWMTVVFLMSSSLLSILYFLATTFLGQSPKKMARIRWPIIILSGLGTLGALVLFLVPYFFELLLNSLNSHVDGQMDVGWAYKGSIGIFVIACLHLLSTALLSSSRHRIEPSSASEKGTATKSWNGM